ncbi:MAG: hypothetical protein CMH56_05785 [Myxococcales bacterium]|nr:hypothetical protein [Myxococcales bacterium]|tara:strand:- start:534 stop:1424 length:891 start_codon:yes stop_codon:yes gene_type:complete
MDTLTRWLLPETGIKISIICATNTLKTAQKQHTTLTSSSVALGRAMMGALCLAAEEKDPTRIQFHLSSDGPIKTVVVDASEKGEVRGYVGNPLVSQKNHHEREALEDALGNRGHASLFRRPEEGAFSHSAVPLRSGEVDEDLEALLDNSTQIDAAFVGDVCMAEGLFVDRAAGLFVSALPDASLDNLNDIFSNVKSEFVDALGGDWSPVEEQSQADWLQTLFKEDSPQLLDRRPVQFKCTCSQERINKTIEAMGTQDLIEMAEEGDQTITCDFCNTAYTYAKPDLDLLCANRKNAN